MAIVYMEGRDPAEALEALSASRGDFEVWFKAHVLEIHGIDFNQPMPGPISEVICEWSAG